MGIFLLINVSFEDDRKQHYEKICEFDGGVTRLLLSLFLNGNPGLHMDYDAVSANRLNQFVSISVLDFSRSFCFSCLKF